ncbi:hypothetical protein FRB90_001773, partial [Tulasnella sp. 427]
LGSSAASTHGKRSSIRAPSSGDISLHSSASTPPIQTLPEELFFTIIDFSVNPSCPVKDLVRLILVCRSWHTIIENTSSLWCRISGGDDLHHLRKALDLSQHLPLDISYDETTSNITPGAFFKEVGPYIERWRLMVAEFRSENFSFAELETRPAPILEKLHLIYRPPWSSRKRSLSIFGGFQAPSTLQDLRVVGLAVPLDPLRLARLKQIAVQKNSALKIATAMAIIRDSPELEGLELSHLEDPTTPDFDEYGQIQLPLLYRLSLFLIPVQMAERLLPNLHAPSLRKLSVTLEVADNPRISILPFFSSLLHTMKSMVHDATAVKVNIIGNFYGITIGGLDLSFRSNQDKSGEFAGELFLWLVKGLGDHLLDIPVTLSLNDCRFSFVNAEWLSFRVKVTDLYIWSDPYFGPSFEDAILALSKPDASQSNGWFLPHMDFLETNLTWEGGNWDLVDMISKRRSAAMAHDQSGGNSGAIPPRRFREIRLEYGGKRADRNQPPEIEFMKRIQEAAGDADIYWDDTKWEPKEDVMLKCTKMRDHFQITYATKSQEAARAEHGYKGELSLGQPVSPAPTPGRVRPFLMQTLPSELFLGVIGLSVGSRCPINDLAQFSSVCQSWSTMIEGSPSLWCQISGGDKLHHLWKALDLSQSLPLNLEYDEYTSKIKPEVFFKTVGPHIGRWRTLVARIDSTNFSFAQLATRVAPNLEKLHLVYEAWRSWQGSISIFGGLPAPSTLTDFKVVGLPIALAPLRMTRLKKFGWGNDFPTSSVEVLMLLRRIPELEEVELRNLWDEGSDTLSGDDNPLTLPSLARLDLTHVSANTTQLLLSNLSVPNLCRLKTTISTEEPTVILPLLASVIKGMKPTVSNFTAIEVHFWDYDYHRVRVGDIDIGFESAEESIGALSYELFGWLTTIMLGGYPMGHPVTLSVDDSSTAGLESEWISSRIKVTRLEIWHNTHLDDSSSDPVSVLSQPNASSSQWILPHLEVLETNMIWEKGNLGLVDMIRNRQSASFQARGDTGAIPPKSLREIWLCSGKNQAPDIEFLKDVQDVGSGADVYWDGVRWGASH